MLSKTKRLFQASRFAFAQMQNYCLQKISSNTGLFLAKPDIVIIDITNRCNSRCRYCDYWQQNIQKELTTDQWKTVISSLRKWLGPFNITFSGGEPLLRKDMPDLIRHCSENDIYTNMITNGLSLTEEVIKKLADSGLTRFTLSIDSYKSEVHDYVRGINGNWEKSVNGLKLIKKYAPGAKITVATVIHKKNIGELDNHVRWINGLDVYGVLFQPIGHSFASEDTSGRFINNDLWPDDSSEVSMTVEKLIDLKKNGSRIINSYKNLQLIENHFNNHNETCVKKDCRIGVTNFAIKPDGRVLFCYYLDEIGRFYDSPGDTDAFEIWSSKKAKELRNSIKNCNISCSITNYNHDIDFIEKVKKFIKLFLS